MSGDWGPDSGRRAQAVMQFTGQYVYRYPIQAKDRKDIPGPSYIPGIPGRSLVHEWLTPVDVNKLPRLQMKVKMCCAKCEEKVLEEIWEVPCVFDVKAFRIYRKVVVTYLPWPMGLDVQHEVLKKARKIDCKARFMALDIDPKPPPKPLAGGKVQGDGNTSVPKQLIPQAHPAPPSDLRNPDYRPKQLIPPGHTAPPSDLRNPDYRPDPFYSSYAPPSQDGVMPYYFFLFLLMLVSMFVFRK